MTKNAFKKAMYFFKRNFDKLQEQVALNKSFIGLQRKNLLKVNKGTIINNGVTFVTNKDGTVTLFGTPTGNPTYAFIGNITLKAGNTYKLTGAPSMSNDSDEITSIRLSFINSESGTECALDNGTGGFVTADQDMNVYVRIRCQEGDYVDGLTFYPMVRLAEFTDGTYEPYIADDLQTQIENVGYMNEFVTGMRRKNMLKVSIRDRKYNGITYKIDTDGSISTEGTATGLSVIIVGNVFLKAGHSYIITGVPEGANVQNSDEIRISLMKNGDTETGGKDIGFGYTYYCEDDMEFGVRLRIGQGCNADNLTFHPMVREAFIEDDSYEPYVPSLQEQIKINKLSLGMQSKNLLENGCSSYSKTNLSCEVQEDGSMVFNGTSGTSASIFYWNIRNGAMERIGAYIAEANLRQLPPGEYILSGGSANIGIQLMATDESNNEGKPVGAVVYDTEMVITIPDNKYVWTRIYVKGNATITNEVVRPMIRPIYITNSTYEPYVPDLQTQINTNKEQVAINKSSLGLQRKNYLMNRCTAYNGNGLNITVNKDGSITLKGRNESNSQVMVFSNFQTGAGSSGQTTNNKKFIPTGDYILSGGGPGYRIQICANTENKENILSGTSTKGSTAEVKFTITDEHQYSWTRLIVYENADFGEETIIYPMIRPAEITDNTYEPYKPSLQEQINTNVEDLQGQIDSIYGAGKVIPDSTDLNDVTTPGSYYSSSQAHTITMKNLPYNTGGFRLEVYNIAGNTSRLQKLYGNSTAEGLKVYFRFFVSNVWSSWHQMSFNKVETLTTSSTSQTMDMGSINSERLSEI